MVDLVIYTVIYITSFAYSYILLSQFTTQVAKNTITWTWVDFYVFGFLAITSIASGFFSLAELQRFLGGGRSRASSMLLLIFKIVLWITVAVELVAIAAVVTILELGVVGSA
jgi:hypothetical protein